MRGVIKIEVTTSITLPLFLSCLRSETLAGTVNTLSSVFYCFLKSKLLVSHRKTSLKVKIFTLNKEASYCVSVSTQFPSSNSTCAVWRCDATKNHWRAVWLHAASQLVLFFFFSTSIFLSSLLLFLFLGIAKWLNAFYTHTNMCTHTYTHAQCCDLDCFWFLSADDWQVLNERSLERLPSRSVHQPSTYDTHTLIFTHTHMPSPHTHWLSPSVCRSSLSVCPLLSECVTVTRRCFGFSSIILSLWGGPQSQLHLCSVKLQTNTSQHNTKG